MSGKTARSNRKNAAEKFAQSFPPVDKGTVIFVTGVLNLPIRVALSYGDITIYAALDSEASDRKFQSYKGTPYFKKLGFGEVGDVEVVVGTTANLIEAYSFGGSAIEMFSMPDDLPGIADIETIAQGLPEPTSLVVSDGFFSILVDHSGRISQYEHPHDEVVRLVDEVNKGADVESPLASVLEARLCPQEIPHIWFGDYFCAIDRNGHGAWYEKPWNR